jgi:hypothetical protein
MRALSFVIANRQGRCVFLDLGLRENWSLPPPPPPGVVAEIHNNQPGIRHELNASDILKLHDFRINNIEVIILRLLTPSFPLPPSVHILWSTMTD